MDGHAEADVGLVGAVIVHGIVPAHAGHGVGNIHVQDVLEDGAHHALEHVQDVFLLHEGHFAVNLGEFGLTVRAEVFVTETAHNLEVAVVAGHHQQLLEGLGALRQGVELAGIHAGRDHEVAGAFRSALDQVRRLDFHEPVGVQVVTHLMSHFVTQGQGALQRTAAQVQVTVFGAEVFAAVALLLNGEGRSHALVQDMDGRYLDFDVTGGHLGVFRLTFNHFSLHLNHEFTAQGGGHIHQGSGSVGLHDQLGDAVTVTEVDKGHAAQFAGFLYPSGKGHLLPFVLNAELSACVCSVHSLCYFCLLHGNNLQK